MKHLVGIGVLIAMAFIVQSWLHASPGLDIYIHNTYLVMPLGALAFWCLMGSAFAWLLFFAWASIRRHS
jgi:hypothetical protein